MPPVVLTVTSRLPGGGGGVGQSTANEVEVELPAGTVTVLEAPPLTLQLLARPLRVTVWSPAARLSKVTRPPFVAMC